jgi:hypothetical protein
MANLPDACLSTRWFSHIRPSVMKESGSPAAVTAGEIVWDMIIEPGTKPRGPQTGSRTNVVVHEHSAPWDFLGDHRDIFPSHFRPSGWLGFHK